MKNLLTSRRTIMVLILGGDHDLENNIKRRDDTVEYVRVVVKTHKEVAGSEMVKETGTSSVRY